MKEEEKMKEKGEKCFTVFSAQQISLLTAGELKQFLIA